MYTEERFSYALKIATAIADHFDRMDAHKRDLYDLKIVFKIFKSFFALRL
jgi:hypothetical protein